MTNLQLQPGWSIHTPNDGSQIGGVQPAAVAFWRGAPLLGTQAMLGVEGPSWATVEAYISLPPMVSPTVQLSLSVTIDAPSLASLALVEIDLKRIKGGKEFNHSQQQLLASNKEQLSDVGGGWIDTGIISPAYQPGVPLMHAFEYAYDPVKLTYGTQGITIGTQVFFVHPGLQNLVPRATTWPDQELVQVQITLAPLAAGTAVGRGYVLIDNVSLAAL